MTPNASPVRPLAGALLALAFLTAACGSSSVPASREATAIPSTGPGVTVTPAVAEPTPVPGGSGGPGTGGGAAGSGAIPGNPGSSGPIVYPGPDGNLPPAPDPTIVTPTTGLTGVHAVQAADLEAAVNGRDVTVRVAWWSGVAPCSALAGITVTRDGSTFLLTVNEGSAAAPDQVCIDIAMYKAGVVDLGELEPGTYTIKALGDAPPVEVTVAG
jgi:hypothetical protein